MLKLSKTHKIYEIHCEWAAESVFIDHKPSPEELKEIQLKNWPELFSYSSIPLLVDKLKPFYTISKKTHKN